MPTPSFAERVGIQVLSMLGLYNPKAIHGPRFKPEGYRTEEIGPISFERSEQNRRFNCAARTNFLQAAGMKCVLTLKPSTVVRLPVLGRFEQSTNGSKNFLQSTMYNGIL